MTTYGTKLISLRATLVVTAFVIGQPSFPAGSSEGMQLPNLVALQPYEITIGHVDDWSPFDPHYALRFTVAIVNRGLYAFDMMGIPEESSGIPITARAMQCVEWAEPTHRAIGICLARDEVGQIAYHAEHQHWHLQEFTSYELRRLDDAGKPVMTPNGLVASSDKVGYCLQNVRRDSEPAPEGSPFITANVYGACSLAVQGISPGFLDEYDSSLPGQQIPIDNVPDGSYALVITVNPQGRFPELTMDDNVAFTRIVLVEGRVTSESS